MSASEYYEQELEKITMSESKDKPAFPNVTTSYMDGEDGDIAMTSVEPGLSKLEYAAIHLKVPLSGTPWLDEMIEASRRDDFAKVTAAAQFLNKNAWKDADALIKAADEGMGDK